MRIAVIGGNGNLGSRVCKQALDRGHEVIAIIYGGKAPDDRAEVFVKSLFELEKEDIEDVDVIISAYGSGFQVDPVINIQAFQKYIDLMKESQKQLIVIGGAGSLYTESSHTLFEYEQPSHPEFLREVSKNIKLGIDELKKCNDFRWTVVCPSRKFDPDGPLTGEYLVGVNEEIILNEDGNSYVTYEDLAKAMIDIAEEGIYWQQKITVATKKLPIV